MRSSGRVRRVLLPAVVLLATLTSAGLLTASAIDTPCLGFVDVPGQGPSCPIDGGWEVILEDGTRLPTHGADRPRSEPEGPVASSLGVTPPEAPPTCAPAGTYGGLAIYARPQSSPDNYASERNDILTAVKQANGVLRMEGAEMGRSVSFRMRCDAAGEVLVANVPVPLSDTAQSFAQITQALKNKGYTAIDTKYWVFWDGDTSCTGCAGQGTLYYDDRLVLENYNNAASGTVPMFAIAYTTTYFDFDVILHEAAHNLGAVQRSAPHTTAAGHCNDGKDIMCYADGGSSSSYSSGVCADRKWFDCGHDDYFHVSPPAGSYLATRWNLGSTLNRFIDFSPSCDFARADTLTLGLLGVGWEGVASKTFDGIPSTCWNTPFMVAGEDPFLADVDVCWLDGTTQISCASAAGEEIGKVPSGTTAMRVTAYTAYNTRVWIALG